MTPKQRVERAVTHRETDICPYMLNFSGELRRRLVEFTGDANFDSQIEQHFTGTGPEYPNTNERIDENHYRDAFGVIWEESIPGEIGMVRDPVLKEPSLKGYDFPSAMVPGLFDSVAEQLALDPDAYSLWSLGFSLYERAWSLRGIENFLLDLIRAPKFADELLERICEFNLDMVDQICRFDIDCVRFGDDWGAQKGLIMGPKLWRRFIKPRFARMVERAASYGKATFLHCDGDIREIIPDLIEISLTILNPVQPDVMDIYEIKREYGRDLTFLGGVSVQYLLPRCRPDEVRAELRRLIREMGKGGGFIISPTHTLGPDIPLENMLVLMEELTQQAYTG